MSAHILRFPADPTIFARLTERQRAANISEERAEAVEDARAVLKSPKRHSDQILRDACAVLQAWGDGHDYLTADAMIVALNRRERLRAHNAALEAAREARRGTIRGALVDMAVLLAFGAAVLAVVYVGGPM